MKHLGGGSRNCSTARRHLETRARAHNHQLCDRNRRLFPKYRYPDTTLARDTRYMSWISLPHPAGAANRSHQNRAALINPEPGPATVLDLVQFVPDAQLWMNDYRWYDEYEECGGARLAS